MDHPTDGAMPALPEPLPCPFCGAVGLDFTEGSTFRWIEPNCSGCGASCGEVRVQTLGEGPTDQWAEAAKKDAIEEWNRRTPDAAPLVARVAELQAERDAVGMESIGWIDDYGNFERQYQNWMQEEKHRGVNWRQAFVALAEKEQQS